MDTTGNKCAILSIFEGAEMARRRGQRSGHLYERSGMWMLRYRVDSTDGQRERITVPIAHASGPEAIGKRSGRDADVVRDAG